MKLEVTEAAIVLRVAAIEADSTLAVSPIPAEYPRLADLLQALEGKQGNPVPIVAHSVGGADFHLVPGMVDESLCRGRGGVLEWVPLEVQSKRSQWGAPVGAMMLAQ